MIKLNINLDKITNTTKGKKGRYVDLILFTNRNGTDDYGNDGFIAEDVTKEERERGQKGAIVGNWRDLSKRQAPAPRTRTAQKPSRAQAEQDSDDIPF